jgi:hypothetical protein
VLPQGRHQAVAGEGQQQESDAGRK